MKSSLIFLFALFVPHIHAHNAGNICGTVSDSISGISLVGVNIQIRNSLIGTSTDLNGKFELKNVQIGTYELIFSSLGYQTVVRKILELKKTSLIHL